jgi:hypothetical protein
LLRRGAASVPLHRTSVAHQRRFIRAHAANERATTEGARCIRSPSSRFDVGEDRRAVRSMRPRSRRATCAVANHLLPIRSIPIGVECSKCLCGPESKKNFHMVNRCCSRSATTPLHARSDWPCENDDVKHEKNDRAKTLMSSVFSNTKEEPRDASRKIFALHRRCTTHGHRSASLLA